MLSFYDSFRPISSHVMSILFPYISYLVLQTDFYGKVRLCSRECDNFHVFGKKSAIIAVFSTAKNYTKTEIAMEFAWSGMKQYLLICLNTLIVNSTHGFIY